MVYIYAFALFSEYIEAFRWIQAIFDVGMSADDTAATRGKKIVFSSLLFVCAACYCNRASGKRVKRNNFIIHRLIKQSMLLMMTIAAIDRI